jgi:hypothetical protein
VTDHPRTLNFNLDHKGIAVAIGARGNYFQAIAGSFALGPKLVASAAVKRHVPQGLSAIPCCIVHEAEHKDFAVAGILHDCWNQALHFVEVNFHKSSSHKGHEGSRSAAAELLDSYVTARSFVP